MKERLEDLKNAKYNDLEDMVYRMQLTCDEIKDILDLKYILSKRTGSSLYPGIYEISDLNKTLEYILLNNVNICITIDDIKLNSKLCNNQTLIIT